MRRITVHIWWMAHSFAGQIVLGKASSQGPLAPCLVCRTRTRIAGNGLLALQSEPWRTAGVKDSLPFGMATTDMRSGNVSVV